MHGCVVINFVFADRQSVHDSSYSRHLQLAHAPPTVADPLHALWFKRMPLCACARVCARTRACVLNFVHEYVPGILHNPLTLYSCGTVMADENADVILIRTCACITTCMLYVSKYHILCYFIIYLFLFHSMLHYMHSVSCAWEVAPSMYAKSTSL